MKKEEQKQHLIDIMRGDEELGLYKEEKQDNCCTPIGQIKRYVDCKGCDKKPKKENTLEEKAEEYEYTDGIYGFKAGAKWQQERMYSEEEVKQIIEATLIEHSDFVLADIPKWFEQFKKK
jgi:hypothetical protein